MTYIARSVGVGLLLLVSWLLMPVAYAQDSVTPFIEIVNVDRSQAPTVQLGMVGGNLAGDLSTLPVALFAGDQAQTIVSDQTAIAGVQMALVVDPHNILALGPSGQTHHAEVVGATLDLIEHKVITRNVDLLAAYSMQADGALQTVQDWTKEPNLIFNSTVQTKSAEVGENVSLTDLLLQVLDKFQTQTQSPQLARSLLLFSAGASPFDLAKVVASASEHNIHIHTVEMAAANEQPPPGSPLQQLAQQTHGKYVFAMSTQNLDTLWTALAGLRIQRTLTYKADNAVAAPLTVKLTLASGSVVEASFNATNPAAAVQSTQAATATTSVATLSATTAPVAAAVAATATVASAPPTSVPTADQAPATDNAPVVEANGNNMVVIPGLGVAVPRIALQLALPVLILLLAYFIYRDLRERKARTPQGTALNRQLKGRDNRLFELSDSVSELKPLPKSKPTAGNYGLQASDDVQVRSAEPVRTPVHSPHVADDEQNEEATIVPRPMFGDDEATYRRSDQIEQPIIGYFVRVAGNPTLPNELPIYGLGPARGEARQIHIGRHSKNNTVVINDKSISREHAVIVQKEGRLYLRDNASTAGTFLNGKRLQPGEELLLRHNDLVSFGEVAYEFHARGEDEATVASE